MTNHVTWVCPCCGAVSRDEDAQCWDDRWEDPLCNDCWVDAQQCQTPKDFPDGGPQ